jgi:hypothetical protein
MVTEQYYIWLVRNGYGANTYVTERNGYGANTYATERNGYGANTYATERNGYGANYIWYEMVSGYGTKW